MAEQPKVKTAAERIAEQRARVQAMRAQREQRRQRVAEVVNLDARMSALEGEVERLTSENEALLQELAEKSAQVAALQRGERIGE